MANPREYSFTDEELDDLIAQAEGDLVQELRKHAPAAEKLRKDDADGDGPPKKDEDSDGDASAPADASASAGPPDASASAPSAPPAPPMDGSDGSAPPPDASASADPAAQAAEGEAPLSAEALAAEYAQLPPEELEMHRQALEMAMAQVGGGSAAGPGAGAPPAAPPAPSAPPMGSAPAMKGEMNAYPLTDKISRDGGEGTDKRVTEKGSLKGGDGGNASIVEKREYGCAESGGAMKRGHMGKSEKDPLAELAASKDAEIENLKKSYEDGLGAVVGALEKFLGQPQQKAVTTIAAVGKPGDDAKLRKAEELEAMPHQFIVQQLSNVARRPDLKKSDRDLINKFCVHKATTADIAYLLVDEAK